MSAGDVELETIEGSIYDWPKYYEFIYGSDWQAECRFLVDCFDTFVDGKVQRLFEPACGTGRLIYRLGKQGYQVSGLDLNPHAVEYCNKRLTKHDIQGTSWVGDMCDFTLKTPCDAAFNTINSFRHLTDDQAAVEHLRSMAAAVRKGGIYVLGLHLTPVDQEPEDNESWSHRRGSLQVNADMYLVERHPRKRLETYALSFDVYTPSKQFRIQDQFQFRTYTYRQFQALLDKVPAFQVVEVFDFAYDYPILPNGSTQDAVFVLKKC